MKITCSLFAQYASVDTVGALLIANGGINNIVISEIPGRLPTPFYHVLKMEEEWDKSKSVYSVEFKLTSPSGEVIEEGLQDMSSMGGVEGRPIVLTAITMMVGLLIGAAGKYTFTIYVDGKFVTSSEFYADLSKPQVGAV